MAFNAFVDMDITKGIDLTFCPLWPFPDWYINDERASILPHIEVSTSNAKNDSLRYASVQGAYFTINVYFSGVCMYGTVFCIPWFRCVDVPAGQLRVWRTEANG